MLSRFKPGRSRPRSRAWTLNGVRPFPREGVTSPRRRVSLTTARKGRPERRACDFSFAATSSSSVRVVRTPLMLAARHHDVNAIQFRDPGQPCSIVNSANSRLG